MKIVPRLLFQCIGAVTLVLCVWGCYLAISTIRSFRHFPVRPELPFFRMALWTMSAIDAFLLVGVSFASFRLLRLKPNAALTYTCTVLASVGWAFAPGFLWLLPNGVGMSIGAASGISHMGTGPLILFPIPFIYPLASVVLVNIAWRRLKPSKSDVTLPQQEKPSPA
jgi:hypothetical protein